MQRDLRGFPGRLPKGLPTKNLNRLRRLLRCTLTNSTHTPNSGPTLLRPAESVQRCPADPLDVLGGWRINEHCLLDCPGRVVGTRHEFDLDPLNAPLAEPLGGAWQVGDDFVKCLRSEEKRVQSP